MNDIYKRLRKHLDTLPVGFPKTFSGVEYRLLQTLFTEEEASLACALSWKFYTIEEIRESYKNIKWELPTKDTPSKETIEKLLKVMASKGSVLERQNKTYALMPFIIGMFELQVNRLTKPFIEDTFKYAVEGYGIEFLATGTAQTRIVPIGASVKTEHAIANYDEFKSLIENTKGEIALINCVCRKAADILGNSCKATERRELCMVFRDFAYTTIREGWGRKITKEEALEVAALNETEGLVMRTSNEKEPQFLCGCCGDCCGLLGMIKAVKRPADFVASNFISKIDAESCVGCGLCVKRCPMQAISLEEKKACVLEARCIGCGVCVPNCRKNSIKLSRKEKTFVPPDTTEDLLEALAQTRRPKFKQIRLGLKAILGFKTKPHG